MKTLRTLVAVGGGIASVACLSSAVLVGCSGDDSNTDGGKDTGSDSPVADTGTPDVQPVDTGTPDVQADGGDPVENFLTQLATTVCGRLQTCCGGASQFDYKACTASYYHNGWYFSHLNLTYPFPSVRNGGRVTLDATQAQSCLAGLSTLSCPTFASAEQKSLLTSCFGALVGVQTPNSPCNGSIECQPGNYCNIPAEAGAPVDGGSVGACNQLLDSGVRCGQQPYQSWYYSSEQCSYNSGPAPARFCNYDDANPANWFCAPLRANNQPCYTDNECASKICDNIGNNNFVCVTSVNIGSYVCPYYKPKDAGTD
jgi:hypothetical protein